MLFFILFVLEWSISNAGHVQYECGAHGRFEYCIDDIPGCVIGCYCHPGYYFDTETKICEPNTKLTKGQYRRSDNSFEIFKQPTVTTTPKQTEVTTKSNSDLVGDKINHITNSVDDLSDWLYREFFHTIEKQVTNNTDENIEAMDGRRKSKSKHGKNSRKKKKLKKSKKKNMRIREDDSIFDSSSSGSSSESDESSDSDSSDNSYGYNRYENNKFENNNGERKIVLIHKKPKTSLPSLPSFFFVPPGGGTDYYPPLQFPGALFPPPVLPLPPILNPYPPSVIVIDANSTLNSTTKSPNENITKKSNEPKHENTFDSNKTEKPLVTSTPALTNKPKEELTNEEIKKTDVTEASVTGNNEEIKLREGGLKSSFRPTKHKKKNKKVKSVKNKRLPLIPEIMTDIPLEDEEEVPIIDEDVMVRNELYRRTTNPYSRIKGSETSQVNVKYLVQLIHKNDDKHDTFLYENKKPFFNNIERYRQTDISKLQQRNKDDLFYGKLGEEIASIVRNVDFNNNNPKEVNIEIQSSPNDVLATMNKNVLPSHPYWGRVIRSSPGNQALFYNPIIFLDSNEDLLKIENIVSKTATESPRLSLNELESLIQLMDKEYPIADENIKKVKVNQLYNNKDSSYDINMSELHQYDIERNSRHNKPTETPLINNYKQFTEVHNNNNHHKDNNNNINKDETAKDFNIMRYKTNSKKLSNFKNLKYFRDDNISILNHIEEVPHRPAHQYQYEKPLFFADSLSL